MIEPLKKQTLEPWNPGILEPFLPTNWEKNHKYKTIYKNYGREKWSNISPG
jgi:hypothetical protein